MLAASPARADWHFAPLFGMTFQGSSSVVLVTEIERHWSAGGAVTLLGAGPIGVEALFVITPNFFEGQNEEALSGSHVYSLMGNVVLAAPRPWNEYGLRPFLSAGLGLLHAEQGTTVEVAFPVDVNFLAFNAGGGAVGFLSERVGVRFDLRYFTSLSRRDDVGLGIPPVRLRYWTGAVGLVFRY